MVTERRSLGRSSPALEHVHVLTNERLIYETESIGTNPEELIATAHASCFSMASSAEFGNAGITPASINTTTTVTLDKTDAGFTITELHLDMTAKIPGIDQAKFTAIANGAKAGCSISRLLNAKVSLDAKLEA
jgi:osmotically inducible protein OsmC